jgi:BolA protein
MSESPAADRIDRIRAALGPLAAASIDLIDDSAQHAGHAGARDGGGHYRLEVVADRFAGLTRVQRHRLVYDLLARLLQREIHALSLSLSTPDERRGRLDSL